MEMTGNDRKWYVRKCQQIVTKSNVQNETGKIILWQNTTVFEKLSCLIIIIKRIPWTARASSRSKIYLTFAKKAIYINKLGDKHYASKFRLLKSKTCRHSELTIGKVFTRKLYSFKQSQQPISTRSKRIKKS